MIIDPFSSHLPHWHPKKVFFKLLTIFGEGFARCIHNKITLPSRTFSILPSLPVINVSSEGGVTPIQIQYLLAALKYTDNLGGVVVEVGAYQGETTRVLANSSKRTIVAVDRYFPGWALAEPALTKFYENTSGLANVLLERKSSGEAVIQWRHGLAGLIFIDAQHNLVSTGFDIHVWSPLLLPGGLLALHDTDDFSGTRLAAWLASKKWPIWSHIENLTILQKPNTESKFECA